MNYKYLFWDLDGTLTDPGEGITNSVMYALEKFNIKVAEREELYRFIGPPLLDSFKLFYNFNDEEAKQGVKFFREYFSVTGIFENRVFDGISETLATLSKRGYKHCVATSKPHEFAMRILEKFDLLQYFDFVSGASMDEKFTDKAMIIKYAMEQLQINSTEVLMIGDREHDIIGANKNGIDSMGVMYGYGCREEFVNNGAKYIANTVEDIARILG